MQPADPDPTPSSSYSSSQAPEHPLPSTSFYSVEYPGYVQSSSVPAAINNLGGQSSLDQAFKRTASKNDSLLELHLRPGNPFAHPIPGESVSTSNILLKVVKRKRRKLNPSGPENDDVIGDYTAEAVGIIPKTVRFRSMADYQYQPDTDDPIARLRSSMDNMDVEGVRSYIMPEEKEDYTIVDDAAMQIDPQLTSGEAMQGPKITSNLRFFPPPLFSRQTVPQNYSFKANPMSTVTTVVDDNGEEKKRLINRQRWKGYGTTPIMFTDPKIPDKPPPQLEEVRDQVHHSVLDLLKQRFEERPIWTRLSLFNQFSPAEIRDIHNSKFALPLVAYTFSDGPWRDTLIRFGYDPRQDVNARFYQRLYFRNINHPIVRPSVANRRQENRPTATPANPALAENQKPLTEAERRRSHIFDGVSMTKETAAFQLCDIIDPLLKDMIEDEEGLREAPNERGGWYTTHAFEGIKSVLRHKFFSLVEGYVATDEECLALLSSEPGASKPAPKSKLRFRRHNMAKGAMPPEDAAAVRLRATLEKNMKSSQN